MKIAKNLSCNDGVTTLEQCIKNILAKDASVVSIVHKNGEHIIYYRADYDAKGNVISNPKVAAEVTF